MDQKMWISGASFVANVLEIIRLLFHGKLDFMVKLWTYIEAKSMYVSHTHAVSNYNGTEIEIWAGFGPVGSPQKSRYKICP